ncbi:C13 family peptidase [Parerythrobacter jejuensis]|uniref:Peptidase C13 n=1 Tax=Parerythrobacter jejuensis TaxID=795812 RepID=A0A845AUR5_9SPHN|nr:C13 family peptidase [Parerythrobacter jejuensis]MXP32551.1 peptidase C13 [Parerythrobacter jejuensis]
MSVAQAQPEPVPDQPPEHTQPWPGLGSGAARDAVQRSLALGPELRRNLSVQDILQERRRLDAALAELQPHRPGTVDAYVLTVALDSDPVFSRETREAGRVLGRRYGADGRTLVLAGPDGRGGDNLPQGSITALTLGLARIAELMDPEEDVLVLYSTSHGLPMGVAYHYGDTGYGILSPKRLFKILEELEIKRRILMISACYSGVFVEPLKSADTAILTAAHAERPSFGCRAENDWTYFGDALINRALRKPVNLSDASREAQLEIAKWEKSSRLRPSLPQVVIGENVAEWLTSLEAAMPATATEPVGQPSFKE